MGKHMTGPSGEWQLFFKDHLDRSYCVTCHLAESLPELLEQVAFADQKRMISRRLKRARQQQLRLEALYTGLGLPPNFDQCRATVLLVEDAFTGIRFTAASPELRLLSLCYYLRTRGSLLRHWKTVLMHPQIP